MLASYSSFTPLLSQTSTMVAPAIALRRMAPMVAKRTFITVVNQYEQGVTLTLGKFTSVKKPGLRMRIPILQEMFKVEMRTKTADLPKQDVITSDNVSISVDAILYYKVTDPNKAILSVEDGDRAVKDLAKIKLRELLSQSEVNTILHQRERFSTEIMKSMSSIVEEWGMQVQNVSLKDISFDAGMQRAMAKKAEAERLREAKVIHAESEAQTAAKLLDAAKQLEQSPIALRLRELDTLQQIAKEPNHSSVFIPITLSDALSEFMKNTKKM